MKPKNAANVVGLMTLLLVITAIVVGAQQDHQGTVKLVQ